MTEYSPDRWTMIELKSPTQTVYKIMASWYGGYLDSDSWKLSSGVESVTFKDDVYYYQNASGSLYKCHKDNYGMSGYTAGVFTSFEQHNSDEIQIRALKQEEAEKLTFGEAS